MTDDCKLLEPLVVETAIPENTGRVVLGVTDIINSHRTHISIAEGKGRGVFASEFIQKGSVIEQSPVIVIKGSLACQLVNESSLADHVYDWSDEDGDAVAIGLGHTSLYNTDNDFNPNAAFDCEEETIVITALRDILPGEEITIEYRDPREDLRESMVDICYSLASFKKGLKDRGISKKFEKEINKMQESIHQLGLKYLPKNTEDEKYDA